MSQNYYTFSLTIPEFFSVVYNTSGSCKYLEFLQNGKFEQNNYIYVLVRGYRSRSLSHRGENIEISWIDANLNFPSINIYIMHMIKISLSDNKQYIDKFGRYHLINGHWDHKNVLIQHKDSLPHNDKIKTHLLIKLNKFNSNSIIRVEIVGDKNFINTNVKKILNI